MTPTLALQIVNFFGGLCWLFLIVSFDGKITRRFVHSGLASAALSGLYLIFLIATIVTTTEPGGFFSLADIHRLFSTDWGLLAAWTHFIAFDLLIASYTFQGARFKNVFLRGLLIILFCVFGPVAYLLSRLISIEKKEPS